MEQQDETQNEDDLVSYTERNDSLAFYCSLDYDFIMNETLLLSWCLFTCHDLSPVNTARNQLWDSRFLYISTLGPGHYLYYV